MMIVDAHQDIAFGFLAHGRDFFHSAQEKRARESAFPAPPHRGLASVGLPDLQTAGVGLIIASLYMQPDRFAPGQTRFAYKTPEEAQQQALLELDYYQRLAADPQLRLVESRAGLQSLLAERVAQSPAPTGLIIQMEGAECIISPEEAAEWQQRGVRIIELTWSTGNRYAGGNAEPGPLTEDGRRLLAVMEKAGLILDLSHLAEESFFAALDAFGGHVMASHANVRALVNMPRQLSDEMIKAIVQRDGVIGMVPFDKFLLQGWTEEQGKQAVPLAVLVRHIDHICQLAGDALHVGLGSDFDGGFGGESLPAELDTVADLPRVAEALAVTGYSDNDIAAIMGGNWLRFLSQALPAR